MVDKMKKLMRKICIISQNVRGIKSNTRLELLFNTLSKRKNVWGMCIQETWRIGHEVLDFESYKLVTIGLRKDNVKCNRGSQGVGIILNKDGVSAWKTAGYEKHVDLGARVMALRLLFKDKHNRDVAVFLISAYAPVGSAPNDEWDEYLENLLTCINRKREEDILIIGSDCNSSIGCSTDKDDGPLGRFGLSHTNASGLRFYSFLAMNELKAATTCFKKKTYATWIHPRSKNPHQIDHFIVNSVMSPRIIDASLTQPVIDSDHCAIFIKLRVMKRLKRKTNPRQRLLNLDYSLLRNQQTRELLCEEFIRNTQDATNLSHSEFVSAVKKATATTLPKKNRVQPDWFSAKQDILIPLIENRNNCMKNVMHRRTRQNSSKLRQSRKVLKLDIKNAKNDWIKHQCQNINNFGTKGAWDAIKQLRGALTKVKPSVVKKMRRPDGTFCTTPEENAKVFYHHFKELYDRDGVYDPNVIDEITQHPTHNGYDHEPSSEEIRVATLKLKDKAPGESGVVSQVLKCIVENDATFISFKNIVLDFWNNENVPDEWNIGRLIILPKKGDLSLPKNYRGIMLLEITYKVIAIILHGRLLPIEEQLDHEQQCGFRPNRGCMDAIFTIKSALRKRREHGLESWVLFLDLVKAFDRVPRNLLWEILMKYGVPRKLVNLLKALHSDFRVKFTIDEVVNTIRNTIGVKQGDILGPILFTFFICAVMCTWRIKFQVGPCIFYSKEDTRMTGRSYRARGESFPLLDSEYADDTAVLFSSRNDLIQGITSIIEHFSRFGTEIHTGILEPRENSKTEVLFCSKPPTMYASRETFDDADLSDIVINGNRYVPVVQQFTYLGSIVSSDGSDEKDIEVRIRKASNAFGALKKSVFGSSLVNAKIKGKVYECCILPILLYGSECWCLSEKLRNMIRKFHNQCIRALCHVNLFHLWKERIKMSDLMKEVGLKEIESYLCKQQLRWVGHVIRMPWERLPRKMLTSWVRSKRPRGCPKFTYGRSINKSLKYAGIEKSEWHELAVNRLQWRTLLYDI